MQHEKQKTGNWQLIITFSVVLFCGISPEFAGQNVLQLMESEFQTIVKSARPAVVEVIATRIVHPPSTQGIQGKLLVEGHELSYQNIGSGIIIDSAGHIVTTGAVVKGADQIEIRFVDGQHRSAKLINIDPFADIAVLDIGNDYIPHTKIGDSDQIDVGSWVVTVGSSYGHSPTLSFGIVSGREILPNRPFYKAIKINTSVNPGNIGGAVVNTSGEIVGIIVATLAEPYSPRYPNVLDSVSPELPADQHLITPAPPKDGIWLGREIGFAIPIKTVQSIAEQIIQHGRVSRGWLGVFLKQDATGVQVTEVLEDSPAQKAGILPQDIIVGFNNIPVHTFLELKQFVATSAPNTHVIIQIRRGEENLLQDVVLGEKE